MARIVVTKLIQARKEEVAEYFANPEAYSKVHAKYYKSFKILAEENNIAYVDEVWEMGGRRLSFTHKIVLNLPTNIEMEIIKGDGKGSREVITFERTPDHTKVTYESDFKLGGLSGIIFGYLARSQMKKVLEEMAEDDRRFIEERSHQAANNARSVALSNNVCS